MNPAFRKTSTDRMIKDFAAVAGEMADRLPGLRADDGTVDVQAVAMAATVDSIGKLHFKEELGQLALLDRPEEATSVAEIMEKITRYTNTRARARTHTHTLSLTHTTTRIVPYTNAQGRAAPLSPLSRFARSLQDVSHLL